MSEDKRQTLFRASLELKEVTGRTLSGVAVPWDRPTRVRDLTGPSYIEAFAPTSADISIRDHAGFPIFVRHDYQADPLGMTRFAASPSEQATVFETNPLAATRRADEMLELVNDGSMRSVSVGFRPIQATVGRMLQGLSVDRYRTEVALRELSLAPTGFGQYAEAGVLAVRDSLASDTTFDQQTDAVRDAIELLYPGADEMDSSCYIFIRDISDAWAVYEVEGGPEDEANTKRGLFKVEYDTADDGAVSLSEPVAVQVSYVPTARAELSVVELRQRASQVHLPQF